MGNAGRHHAPPAVRPRPPQLPPPSEAAIAPGQAIRYEQNFLGGRGVVLDIENRGPGVVVVAGVRLPAGTTVPYHVADNTHRFTLELDAPEQRSTVCLALKSWQPPAPRHRVPGVLKQVVRDAKTKLIAGIVTSQAWVDEPR